MTERRGAPAPEALLPGPRSRRGPPPVLATMQLEKSYGETTALMPLDLRVRAR